MKLVNKKIFLSSKLCLTKGWYLRASNVQVPLTRAEQFRIDEGSKISKISRSIYPSGILIDEVDNLSNYERTKRIINDANDVVLFEATFIFCNNIARADIIERIDDNWHLLEVKSSLESREVKENHIDDIAYTTAILKLCGVEVKRMSLLLVSKKYVNGMSNESFLVEVDCTEQVEKRLAEFIPIFSKVDEFSGADDRPKPELIFQCKDCEFYEKHCLGVGIINPIFDLPRLSQKMFNDLSELRFDSIDQIPEELHLTNQQKIVWNAVTGNKPFFDRDKMRGLIQEIIYPIYYLDFETVSTAIPLYENLTPYQTMVTQYSIHTCLSIDSEVEHFEYLANYDNDDSEALAVKLISDIGKYGSIIVYHAAAEKKFIKILAESVPNLSSDLNDIVDRIVDLEMIIRETYYNKAFRGSYSLKVVLPVLVPEMSYDIFVIGDGGDASAIFAELAQGKYPDNEAAELCNELLNYCKQDTLALVRIHHKLHSLCN